MYRYAPSRMPNLWFILHGDNVMAETWAEHDAKRIVRALNALR